jgi:hypothetical protein
MTCLIFSTIALRLPLGDRKEKPNGVLGLSILDTEDSVCGILDADDDSLKAGSSDLILLSIATYETLCRFKGRATALAPKYAMRVDEKGDVLLGEDLDGFQFFHVLAIRYTGREEIIGTAPDSRQIAVYERVGFGMLHEGALERAESGSLVWKELLLD